MMCFRCEHRAKHLESKVKGEHYQPRCECGNERQSVCGCYMFMPCLPVLVEPQSNDKRPRFAGIISAREISVRVMDVKKDGLELNMIVPNKKKKQVALVWEKPFKQSK